jgi:uncharacterized protein YecE (DUF72 family)
MDVFVGTCGWMYPSWNHGRSLDWYIRFSELNAIELNSSFYRFPLQGQINNWVKKGSSLKWSIKVNRFITHVYKFGNKSYSTWKKFKKLFSKLDPYVHFYLFQLPPSFTDELKERIEQFYLKTHLGKRFALEPRNDSWFKKENIKWAKKLNITWVSIDAPKFSRDVYRTTDAVYVRVHGRSAWYSHNYTDKELKEIADKILKVKPKRCYVFFNNNHAMLENARRMYDILNITLKN